MNVQELFGVIVRTIGVLSVLYYLGSPASPTLRDSWPTTFVGVFGLFMAWGADWVVSALYRHKPSTTD